MGDLDACRNEVFQSRLPGFRKKRCEKARNLSKHSLGNSGMPAWSEGRALRTPSEASFLPRCGNNLRRSFLRRHRSRIDDEVRSGPHLILTGFNRRPTGQYVPRYVTCPRLHAAAMFRDIGADDLHLDNRNSGRRRHGPPCVPRNRQRIDAVGNNRLTEAEVRLAQRIGHHISRWPDLARKHIRRANRLLDCVDTDVGGTACSCNLPRNRGLPRPRQTSKDDKHQNIFSASFASSDMRSTVQGGSNTSLTFT